MITGKQATEHKLDLSKGTHRLQFIWNRNEHEL